MTLIMCEKRFNFAVICFKNQGGCYVTICIHSNFLYQEVFEQKKLYFKEILCLYTHF